MDISLPLFHPFSWKHRKHTDVLCWKPGTSHEGLTLTVLHHALVMLTLLAVFLSLTQQVHLPPSRFPFKKRGLASPHIPLSLEICHIFPLPREAVGTPFSMLSSPSCFIHPLWSSEPGGVAYYGGCHINRVAVTHRSIPKYTYMRKWAHALTNSQIWPPPDGFFAKTWLIRESSTSQPTQHLLFEKKCSRKLEFPL